MEVTLDKRYPVSASLEQAWAVLSDVRATAACMPGAAITEQLDDTHYKGTVKSKVGPSTLLFNGNIDVLGLDETARTLHIVGKGADKSGSSAAMDLTAHLEAGEAAGDCVLVGQAMVKVGGKLAQFGSRLLVPVADVMLGQFADNFSAAAATVAKARPLIVDTPPPHTESVPLSVDVAPTDPSLAADPQPRIAASGAQGKELNVLRLAWAVVKRWLRGRFGSRV